MPEYLETTADKFTFRVALGRFLQTGDELAELETVKVNAEVPIPYPRLLEEAALPQAGSIAEAARRRVTNHG